jgi:2-succinyl-5-enolpyruvyl-6-hydroxy-3-cyclohexene-1-carboxylate synthase
MDSKGGVVVLNSSTQLARSIVRQVIEGGVKDVVISPGSRNAPLLIAFHEASKKGLIELHVRIDERTGGFFALGISKASKRPVALICTSGTAVANYHPAVLEAWHSQAPLLVLTADRPEKLRKTGANQTTIQKDIFGEATSLSVDISGAVCDLKEVFISLHKGPVHANIQFDEPLLPDDKENWLEKLNVSSFSPEKEKPKSLALTEQKGVLVIGHDRAGLEIESINNFIEVLGLPVVAEDPISFPMSQSHAAIFLTSEKTRELLRPEVVIVIGRTTLSRSVNALVKSAKKEIVIDPRIALIDIKRTADQVFTSLPTVDLQAKSSPEWIALWNSYSDRASNALSSLPNWGEANIAKAICAALPDRSALFISSSRPIRDIEGFAVPRNGIETFANRGLAGIDGNISTALGIASQRGSAIAVLGDLAFLHDVTGLIGAERINARIIVINNDGGGIFSTLPQSAVDGFEKVFGTPHGRDLVAIAKGFGVEATEVRNIGDLLSEVLKPIIGLSVVVALVPSREMNAKALKDLYLNLA